MSSRTDDDPEGGELAQLMRSLGEGTENGAAVRYEKGDKVATLASCTRTLASTLHQHLLSERPVFNTA